MGRHYHLLVAQRGEHFASLTFRKVANWYCRVFKPGREIQQRLMMLERVADNYEREVSHSLSQMTTVLEPVMTLAMAAVIVFMMLAVLMPIFQLNQLMQ